MPEPVCILQERDGYQILISNPNFKRERLREAMHVYKVLKLRIIMQG